MKDKRYILLGLTVLLMTGLFLPFYFLNRSHAKNLLIFSKEKDRPLLVRTIKVHPEDVETELVLPSFLEPINITPILARTSGYLIDWCVDIGDSVREGELLASIDTPEVDQEVVQAEGDLAAALAKENMTRITSERGLHLYACNPEAIAKEELDQMTAAHQQALADIEAAKARLARFKYLQGFKNLYAPFAGTIIKRDIDIGSLITSGNTNCAQQLFQIAKSDVLRAFVNVPQNYFHLIKDGLEAEVIIPQLPKKIFIGRIDRNAGALDPVARTLLTQVNINNKRGELLPGLYAEVKFKLKPDKITFLIPVESMIIRSGPPYVAIVTPDNKVRLQEVLIGRDYGSKVEILEGLSEGDEIVAYATDRIKNGIEIRRAVSKK